MIRAVALAAVTALPSWLAVPLSPNPAPSTPPVAETGIAGKGAATGPGHTPPPADCAGGRGKGAAQDERRAARQMLRCLSPLVQKRSAAPSSAAGEAELSARRLVLTGVTLDVVPNGSGVVLRVRAAQVRADGAVFRFPGVHDTTSGVLRAPQLVLQGPLEVQARQVRGLLLGLLPVLLEARTPHVLAVPLVVPRLEVTDARVSGVSVRAASAAATSAALGVHQNGG